MTDIADGLLAFGVVALNVVLGSRKVPAWIALPPAIAVFPFIALRMANRLHLYVPERIGEPADIALLVAVMTTAILLLARSVRRLSPKAGPVDS